MIAKLLLALMASMALASNSSNETTTVAPGSNTTNDTTTTTAASNPGDNSTNDTTTTTTTTTTADSSNDTTTTTTTTTTADSGNTTTTTAGQDTTTTAASSNDTNTSVADLNAEATQQVELPHVFKMGTVSATTAASCGKSCLLRLTASLASCAQTCSAAGTGAFTGGQCVLCSDTGAVPYGLKGCVDATTIPSFTGLTGSDGAAGCAYDAATGAYTIDSTTCDTSRRQLSDRSQRRRLTGTIPEATITHKVKVKAATLAAATAIQATMTANIGTVGNYASDMGQKMADIVTAMANPTAAAMASLGLPQIVASPPTTGTAPSTSAVIPFGALVGKPAVSNAADASFITAKSNAVAVSAELTNATSGVTAAALPSMTASAAPVTSDSSTSGAVTVALSAITLIGAALMF